MNLKEKTQKDDLMWHDYELSLFAITMGINILRKTFIQKTFIFL